MPAGNSENIILLVEDYEDDVFLTEMAFQSAGVKNRMLVARDGQEAVEYFSGAGQFANRERFPYPALVLLDIKLPYRDGFEVLAWLREQTHLPRTTVVVLTGSNEPRDLKAAYDLGAKTYLVKPPTPQMIYDIARTFNLDWINAP